MRLRELPTFLIQRCVLSIVPAMLAGLLGTCGSAMAEQGTSISMEDLDHPSVLVMEPENEGRAAGIDVRYRVLVFVRPDCPIANGCLPELSRLNKAYRERGFETALVYVAGTTESRVKEHLREYHVEMPAMIDREGVLMCGLDARVTPEAFVIDCDGVVRYRGRVDNRYEGFGKRRPEPTRFDLRAAIEDLHVGRVVEVPRTNAIGCVIREQKSSRQVHNQSHEGGS